MTDQEKQARREYMSKWREANRERLTEYNRKYLQDHRDATNKRLREWRQNNKDKVKVYNRKQYLKSIYERDHTMN